MRRFLFALAAVLAISAATAAAGQVYVGGYWGGGWGPRPYGYGWGPHPPRYYWGPPVVAVVPPPVIYAPPPVYYAPPPGVVVVPAPSANCRVFNGDAIIDGSSQPFYGRACLWSDGRWHIVSG